MIRTAADLDWFQVDSHTAARVREVPGLKRPTWGLPQLHRTHLPLIVTDEAARLCMPSPADLAARLRHDERTQVHGYSLRAHQHAAVEFARQRRGTLIADEPRVGKGQPLSAKVLTPDGWMTMGDLQIGQRIVDPDGGTAEVLGIYPQGIKKVYRVTLTDGSVTECDEEHLWLVQTSLREGRSLPPRVRSTKALMGNLRLRQRANNRRNEPPARWILPALQPIEFTAQEPLPIDPYVLGLLLGDGCFRNGVVSITNASEEVAAAVRVEAERHGCSLRTVQEAHTQTHHIRGYAGKANPFCKALQALDLMGRLSSSKQVPVPYKYASIVDRRALLAGLLDTDGEVTVNGTTLYSTTSTMLRDDTIWLVRSLGGIAWFSTKQNPKYRYRGEERVGQPCYTVTIVMPENPFRLARKAGRWKIGQRRHKIASIEYARDEATQCIRVSSQRQLYVTDDFIVTHNTLAAIATHDPSLGSLVVIAPLMVRETWLSWLRTVFPGEDIGIMIGKTFDRAAALKPIVFGHYQILRHWGRDFPIGTLILDEAHELSNPRTHKAIGAAMLASRAKRVLALTGTPIWNRPIGLWNLLSLIAPGAFGSYEQFGWRYCDPQPTAYGTEFKGSTRSDELDARLSQIRIRRRHADIRADLPPITRDVIIADISDAQRRKLDLLAEGLRKSDRTNTAGQLARYRAVLGEIKIGVVLDRARQILMQEPVVVWTWHRTLAARLHQEFEAAGVPSFLVSGDVSPAKRELHLAAWRAHPMAVLVITIPTGQVGIDLSHAKQALFAEIDYTPALVEQAEKRIYDPTRPSHTTYVIADHVSERRVIAALISKLNASQPLGLTAAEDAIDLFSTLFGRPVVEADMDRLMAALITYDEEQAG